MKPPVRCTKCLQEAAIKAGKLVLKYEVQQVSRHSVGCPKRKD